MNELTYVDCRMLNTEGGRTVHHALEESLQKGTKELKLQGREKKRGRGQGCEEGHQFFELTDKKIGFAGVVTLSEALKTNTGLNSLHLKGLTKGSSNSKQSLEMKNPKTGNGIGIEGTKVLCEGLKENKTMTELDLQSEKDRQRRGRKKDE